MIHQLKQSWAPLSHTLLCFLFLHCSGSQSVGPEPIESASAGNFFESEGMGSSHLCMYKSPKRFSGTQKFQNHYFIWNQHSSLTQAPTANVFIFSSFPSFPLSPTPHTLNGFPDFVTGWIHSPPRYFLPLLPSFRLTLASDYCNTPSLSLLLMMVGRGLASALHISSRYIEGAILLINNLCPLVRFTGLRGLC